MPQVILGPGAMEVVSGNSSRVEGEVWALAIVWRLHLEFQDSTVYRIQLVRIKIKVVFNLHISICRPFESTSGVPRGFTRRPLQRLRLSLRLANCQMPRQRPFQRQVTSLSRRRPKRPSKQMCDFGAWPPLEIFNWLHMELQSFGCVRGWPCRLQWQSHFADLGFKTGTRNPSTWDQRWKNRYFCANLPTNLVTNVCKPSLSESGFLRPTCDMIYPGSSLFYAHFIGII